MYQYNEFGKKNNNNILNNIILALGICLVGAIIVGAKKLFEYLFC